MPAGSPLTGPGYQLTETGAIESISFPLAPGQSVQINSIICFDSSRSDGNVVKASGTSSTLKPIGKAQAAVNNSSGTSSSTVYVPVRLSREVNITWCDNDTGSNAVVAADVGTEGYLLDDHTVTTVSSGTSVSGIIWLLRDNGTTVGVEFPF
jgi:hypothetical protein